MRRYRGFVKTCRLHEATPVKRKVCSVTTYKDYGDLAAACSRKVC